jgi:hypothetical protein
MADRKIETGRHFSARQSVLTIPSILAAAIMLVAFNGGISIGASNHVGLLPVVRRILDPTYLPGDFNIQLRLYHHRAFAYLLAGLSWLLGEEHAVVALHAAGALLLAGSLWFLCRALRITLAGYAAAVLFLASGFLWANYGLEENTFIGNREVQPPLFAHSFVLLAAAFLIGERYRAAAFAAGMAVFFHLQIGVICTLLIAPFYAARLRRFGWRELARLALCHLIPAAPALFHLAGMLSRGLLRPASQFWPLPFYIDFRHPHHFELMSVAHGLWVGGHVAAMILIWLWLRRAKPDAGRAVGVLAGLSASLVLLSLVHFGDYYWLRHDRIANLQMIRLSPLIPVFGVLCLIRLIQEFAQTSRARWAAPAASVCLLLLGAGWAVRALRQPDAPFRLGIERYADEPSDYVRLCNWIKTNGPRDAVYLTPPGTAGFTALTDRSCVVDFKINPDGALGMADWFERLSDLTGGKLPTERGLKNRKPLNKAYGQLSAEQLMAAGKKYNARYAIVPKESKVEWETLHEIGGWRLVKIL